MTETAMIANGKPSLSELQNVIVSLLDLNKVSVEYPFAKELVDFFAKPCCILPVLNYDVGFLNSSLSKAHLQQVLVGLSTQGMLFSAEGIRSLQVSQELKLSMCWKCIENNPYSLANWILFLELAGSDHQARIVQLAVTFVDLPSYIIKIK